MHELFPDSALDAEQAVRAWRITAVGHRPQDYMARDLLHQSLFRDMRPRGFHTYAKDPPGWIHDLTNHLPPEDRRTAHLHLLLHYHHRRWLENLLHAPDQEDFCPDEPDQPYGEPEPGPGYYDPVWVAAAIEAGRAEQQATRARHRKGWWYGQLRRMANCWPYGVEVAPVEEDPARPPRVCGLSRFCPWCRARAAVALHKHLTKGPLAGRDDLFLVQARIEVSSEQFDAAARWVLSQPEDCPTRFEDLPDDNTIWVRDRLGRQLLRFARRLGVAGGLLSYDVRPDMIYNSWFKHTVTLVGAVALPDAERQEAFCRETGITEPSDWVLCVGELMCQPTWLVMPASDPRALRFFLAGSSVGYPLENLDFGHGCFTENPEISFRNGIAGAMELPPNFMLGYDAWYEWVVRLRRMPLYRCFGNWRAGEASHAVGQEGRESAVSRRASGIRGPALEAFKKLNSSRQEEAVSRREQLIALARPLWEQVQAEPHAGRGRPPYRRLLGEALAGQGQRVSVRDLNWLVGELSRDSGRSLGCPLGDVPPVGIMSHTDDREAGPASPEFRPFQGVGSEARAV